MVKIWLTVSIAGCARDETPNFLEKNLLSFEKVAQREEI